MFKNIFLLTLLTFGMLGCGNSQPMTAKEAGTIEFGEKITVDNAIPLAQLVKKMENTDKLEAKVLGKVEAVCQKKGCWMTLVADGTVAEMFVKFKDYGFFMPIDIAGREVIVKGFASKEMTPVDELKHYAEDEGKSQAEIDAITEPKMELKFMASGVVLLD